MTNYADSEAAHEGMWHPRDDYFTPTLAEAMRDEAEAAGWV